MQFPTRVSAAFVLGLLALGTIATAQNQYVILYPGASSSQTILQAYLPTSGGILAKASINTLPAGTFQILPMPDGTKYYVISNGGTPVSTMDSSFSIITQIAGSITLAPSAAALSPDGRRLVVTAGNAVYVIDTSSDTLIAQTGLQIAGKGVDIAINFDSSKAYILSPGAVGPSGTVVTAIDLTSAVPVVSGTPLTLNGDAASPATGLTMAPSGFLYLSNNYRVFEINPLTMAVTTNGEIPVQAYPGKPFITPDGKFVVCANLRPIQGGTLLIQVNIASKVASGFSYTSDTLSQFFNQGPDSKGNPRLYAFSTSGLLYDVVLGTAPIVNPAQINNVFPNALTFTGVQFSNENPPKLMWGTYSNAGNNYLVQVDIVNQNFVQIPIPTAPLKLGTLSVSPFSGGTQLNGFNNNQVIASGKQSLLPIVAQLVDPLGRGIYRGQITFTTATPGVTITTPTVVTGSGGFATTFVTAPTTPGVTFTVTANGGSGVTPIDFTFTIPGSTGGGPGTPGSLQGLSYVSGNGQLVREEVQMNVPMQVLAVDVNGKPAPNVIITWTTDATDGGIQITNQTDSTGVARLILLGVNGVSQSGSPTVATQVSAADPYGNAVNFVFTTTAVTLNNGSLAPDPTVSEYVALDSNGTPIPQFPNGRVINATAGQFIKGAYQVRVTNTAGPFQGQGVQNLSVCFTNVDPNNVDQTPGTGTGTTTTTPAAPICGLYPPNPGPSANCTGNALSDASGLVSCDLKIGNITTLPPNNPVRIFPIVGEFKNLPGITLNVLPGSPSLITKGPASDNQSGKPGAALPIPLAVTVTDLGGNPLSGVTVTWSVILGTGAKLSSTSTVTNNNGATSITATLPPTPGGVKIQAQVSSTLFVQFNATVNAVVGAIKIVSGDNQQAFPNAVFANPLVVLVNDQQGSPLPNTLVTFAAFGAGSVTSASVTTAADGTASTRVTAGKTTGPLSVTAIVGNSQVSFNNLTVIQPGPQITSTSFASAANPYVGLVPCGLGLVTGTGLAPGIVGTVVPTGFGPNPTSLGPVQSVTLGGYAAPLTSVTNSNGVESVGFQVPCELPVGTTSAVVNINGGTTNVSAIPVVAYAPGMFETVASDGRSYAVALRPDGSFAGPGNPAARGEVLRMFVTGLGQTTPAIGTNRAGTGGQSVNTALVGGINNAGVLVIKSEYVAGQIGYYFVDVQIPIDTLTGPYQPIAVAVQPAGGGPLIFGNGVYIPIQ